MSMRYHVFILPVLLLAACSRHHDEDKGNKPEGSSDVTQPKVVLEATTAQPEPVPATKTAPTPPAAGAAKAPPAPPAPDPFIVQAQAKAAEIDNSLNTLTKSEGRWQAGSNESTFTAYFSGANLVYIEEHLNAGDRGSSTGKYYFDGGNLTFYQEEGQWREFNSPAPVNARKIARSMVFDASGRLTAASKTVDDIPAPISEYEALPVLTRAQNLHNVARPPAAVAEAAAEKPAAKGKNKAAKTAGKESPKESAGSKISLAGGSNGTTVSGTVSGKSVREYVITAKDGQTLTLKLDSDQGAATFGVYSNRGEIVSDLKDWSAKLHRDGDYKIRVSAGSGQNIAYHLSVNLQ
ncbi:MAG TPA: hypothetical protein VMH34_04955 [Gammaproteobacteria bacterium]|nr:hypothetical protein [Gammaproteobacteria bacterium]